MRFVRHSASALAFLCLYTLPLTAQNTGTVRGQVVDSSTRQALAGVTVQIQGTARSTVTGPGGARSALDLDCDAGESLPCRAVHHLTSDGAGILRGERQGVETEERESRSRMSNEAHRYTSAGWSADQRNDGYCIRI